MTIGELRQALKDSEYKDGTHVVLALPKMDRGRIEISGLWTDQWGALNIIACERCDEIDPEIIKESKKK